MLVTVIGNRKTGKNKKAQVYRFFRIGRQILIFIFLIAATTVLLRPFQQVMHNRLTELRDSLISRIEGVLGRKIAYSSIGPSIFRTLDIRNIQVYGDDASPVMTIAKVRISYSLITLIRGNIAGSLRTVRIDRPVISIDRERDADLLELFSLYIRPEGRSSGFSLRLLDARLPENVRIWVRNGEAEITGRTNHFKVEGLVLTASLHRERLQFQGNGNFRLVLQELLSEPADVRLSFRLSGECAANLENGNAVLNLASFAENLFMLQPLTVNITLKDNKIALKKINDRAAFDFSGEYDMASYQASGSFRCDNFSPKDCLTLAGPWEDHNRWLAFRISGSASFEHDPEQGIRYTLELSGSVPANLPVGEVSFAVHGNGTQESIAFQALSVQLAQGTLHYQGSLAFDSPAPDGVMSLSDFSLSGGDTINATIAFHSGDKEITFGGNTLHDRSLLVSNLQGSVLFEEGGLTFEASLVRAVDPGEYESPEEVKPGSLSLEGFIDYTGSRYVEMKLTLDSFTMIDILDLVRPFQNLLNLSDFIPAQLLNPLQKISIHTGVYMATDFKHFSYHAPNLVITYENGEALFTGSLSGTEQRFELNGGNIRWEDVDIETSARAEFANLQDISFSLRAAYLDKSYYLEGTILDQNSISIQGLYGLRLYLGMTDSGGYSGYLEADNIPIPYGGQTARFSLKSSLRYDSPEFWFFNLDYLELADIFTPLSAGGSGTVLRVSGKADQQGASFRELFFDDGRGLLQGNLSLSWNNDFSLLSGAVKLNNERGNEWYDITGSFKDRRLALKFAGSDMQIGRFIENSFSAVVSGEADLVWNAADSFSADLNLSSLSARIADKEVQIRGAASFNDEALKVQDLYVRYGSLQLDMPRVTVNRLESRGEAEARFQMIAPSRDVDASLTAHIAFKPIDSWLNMEEAVNSFDGAITVAEARFNNLYLDESFDFIFSRADSMLSFSGGPKDMIRLQCADTGDFYAGLSYPSPIRGTVIGNIGMTDNTIEAQSQDLYIDLTSLWRFIPREAKQIINVTGGFVTASVQIAGTLGDPEFFGTAEGSSVRFDIPRYLTEEVRSVPISVILEGT
ncbi:MAG: hypothetical protein LBD55_10360, partial [Treponema sp.]|nr:hypothetical protein [Treponema sp.]